MINDNTVLKLQISSVLTEPVERKFFLDIEIQMLYQEAEKVKLHMLM